MHIGCSLTLPEGNGQTGFCQSLSLKKIGFRFRQKPQRKIMCIKSPKHSYPKELRSNIARVYDLRFAKGIKLQLVFERDILLGSNTLSQMLFIVPISSHQ